MKITILGLGVIGTTYGYAFQKAGHTVRHWVRESKRESAPAALEVRLFDGRTDPKGEAVGDTYPVELANRGEESDFILIAVSAGKLEAAIQTLEENDLRGTVLLFSGFWGERAELGRILAGRPCVMGYPVAGGSLQDGVLDCVLFDHVMLAGESDAAAPNYPALLKLLASARLKAEVPYDILQWIWLHMAINAGVITTAGKYGDVSDTAQAARTVMASSAALSEAVLCIRETAKIVASRGVPLGKFANELLPYRIPSRIAGAVMRRMFASNELTRRIMELHSNPDDLLYVCRSVYECGRANGVRAGRFDRNYEELVRQLDKLR